MRRACGTYELDDDPARIDPAAAVAFLTTEAYWGRWRGEADIRRQIAEAWRVVGAYDQDGAMVGFARAFGDGGSAYLADVYVLPAHRGAGLGKAIVAMMVEDGPGAGWRWMLHTADAHGLYRRFGFAAPGSVYLERPGRDGAPGRPRRAGSGTGRGTGTLTGPRTARAAGPAPRARACCKAAGQDRRSTSGPRCRRTSQVRRHVETALAARDNGVAVPFAVVRRVDDTVIGADPVLQLELLGRGPSRPDGPDTCEIGYTWLAREALRTGANTEMKRLMLTHAFEIWQVRSVCLHTDVRNQRLPGRDRTDRRALRGHPARAPARRGPDARGLGPVQRHGARMALGQAAP